MLIRHLTAQGDVLRALGKVALDGVIDATPFGKNLRSARDSERPEVVLHAAPRPDALVDDYLRWCGSEPESYRGVLPAHLFPQWTFPAAARALAGLPYPLAKVLNAGFAYQQEAPLPRGRPLITRAQVVDVDANDYRARITTRVLTGPEEQPDALRIEMRAHVPLARKPSREKSAPMLTPDDARAVARLDLPAHAGREFAWLTGDVNPIHWIAPYARLAGFKGCILHGFASHALAQEAFVRAELGGQPERISGVDVRFVKPLPLPSRPWVCVPRSDDASTQRLQVAEQPGGATFVDATLRLT